MSRESRLAFGGAVAVVGGGGAGRGAVAGVAGANLDGHAVGAGVCVPVCVRGGDAAAVRVGHHGVSSYMSKQYTVIDQDGFSAGDFDSLDAAIGRADELCDNPDSPVSRRAKPHRTGNSVYCTEADDQSGRAAQVNKNF